MEENAIYKADYRVRVSDTDYKGVLKFRALFQMLQEIADAHARVLKLSTLDLREKNLGWALSKMAIEVETLPKWEDRVYLKTWASGKERIVTYREFEANDENGNTLFKARSQWILFDSKTRRITKIEKIGFDWPLNPKVAVECDFSNRLTPPQPTLQPVITTVRNDDIDINNHVNNSVYIVWALEPLTKEFFDTHEPSKIMINFLEETFPKNKIESLCSLYEKDELTYTAHSLISKETSHECARLNIQWRKI